MTAGELLRTTRRSHGLTQRHSSIRARTSQAAVSRIERDLVSPSVSTLAELLRLMNEELVSMRARSMGPRRHAEPGRISRSPSRSGWDRLGAICRLLRASCGGSVQVAESFQPRRLLETLVRHDVDFVLTGGMAGTARGSAFVTLDLDVAYERQQTESRATGRGAARAGRHAPRRAARPAVHPRRKVLENGANFTFDTSVRAARHPHRSRLEHRPTRHSARVPASQLDVEGLHIRVASLDHLIAMKEAAGRPKDLGLRERVPRHLRRAQAPARGRRALSRD